jgi:hypothetical protein
LKHFRIGLTEVSAKAWEVQMVPTTVAEKMEGALIQMFASSPEGLPMELKCTFDESQPDFKSTLLIDLFLHRGRSHRLVVLINDGDAQVIEWIAYV